MTASQPQVHCTARTEHTTRRGAPAHPHRPRLASSSSSNPLLPPSRTIVCVDVVDDGGSPCRSRCLPTAPLLAEGVIIDLHLQATAARPRTLHSTHVLARNVKMAWNEQSAPAAREKKPAPERQRERERASERAGTLGLWRFEVEQAASWATCPAWMSAMDKETHTHTQSGQRVAQTWRRRPAPAHHSPATDRPLLKAEGGEVGPHQSQSQSQSQHGLGTCGSARLGLAGCSPPASPPSQLGPADG